MRAYFYLAGAVAALALLLGSFFYGVSVGKDREAVKLQKSIDRMVAAQRSIDQSAHAIDEAAAERDQQRHTIVREIIREVPTVVERPVYRNVCIDDAGVDLLRRSVAAANGDAAGTAVGGPDGQAGGVR